MCIFEFIYLLIITYVIETMNYKISILFKGYCYNVSAMSHILCVIVVRYSNQCVVLVMQVGLVPTYLHTYTLTILN